MSEDESGKVKQAYDLSKARKELDDANDRIEAVTVEKDAANKLLDISKGRITELEEELHVKTSKLTDAKEDLTAAREEVGLKNGIVDDSSRENKRLTDALELARGLKVRYEEDAKELFSKKEILLDENRQLLEEAVDLKSDIRALKETVKKDKRLANQIGKIRITVK